jgi:hypothetical protein
MNETYAKVKKNVATLYRKFWRFWFDPTMDEMRPRTKLVLAILLIIFSLTVVTILKNKSSDVHVIDYVGIMLADVTAGFLLFTFLEHRIVGQEARFEDERNLKFAVSRSMLLMSELHELYSLPDNPIRLKQIYELRDEIRDMINTPDQWRFYGSEALRTALGNIIKIEISDDEKRIAETKAGISCALSLNSGSLEFRKRISKMAVLAGEASAKAVKKTLDKLNSQE